MKEPLVMAVELLLQGGTLVDSDGYEYGMDEDGGLCVIMRDETGNIKPIGIDYGTKQLKAIAEDIGWEELWMRKCAMQLSNMPKAGL